MILVTSTSPESGLHATGAIKIFTSHLSTKVNEASFVSPLHFIQYLYFNIFVCPYQSSEIEFRFKMWIWNVKYACMLVDSGSIIVLILFPYILQLEVLKLRLNFRPQVCKLRLKLRLKLRPEANIPQLRLRLRPAAKISPLPHPN
jgi:hypothetical protein